MNLIEDGECEMFDLSDFDGINSVIVSADRLIDDISVMFCW